MRLLLIGVLVACGSSGSPEAPSDGVVATWGVSYGQPAVLYTAEDFFSSHGVYRVDDVNGDGDYNDPGETTLFYETSSTTVYTHSTVALGEFSTQVIDTDVNTFSRILRLDDLDRDGKAEGSNEVSVWFDGALPDTTMRTIASPTLTADGSVFFVGTRLDNSEVAIYRLRDDNLDGAVTGSEIVQIQPLPFPGAPMLIDAAGNIIIMRFDGWSRVSNEALEPYLSESAVQSAGFRELTDIAAAMPDGSIVFAALKADNTMSTPFRLVSARDVNRDGTIDSSELREIWSDREHITAASQFLTALADGTLLSVQRGSAANFFDQGTEIVRFHDADASGDFRQVDETYVARDVEFSMRNSQFQDLGFVSGVLVDRPVPPREPKSCAWLAGRWEFVTKTPCSPSVAPPIELEIYQDGCDIYFIEDGHLSGEGTVAARTANFGPCGATLGDKTIEVSCQPIAECGFTLTHP